MALALKLQAEQDAEMAEEAAGEGTGPQAEGAEAKPENAEGGVAPEDNADTEVA